MLFEIYSNLTTKGRRSGVFLAAFELILLIILVFPLLISNNQTLGG